MLTHIHIENYTIIEHLDLDFNTGMTVLTGETGAGKSIIIDALDLVLGGRADSKAIRAGAERCDIIAGFDIMYIPTAQQWLAAHDFGTESECLIRRTLSQDGRSKSYLNGKPVSLQSIRELGTYLVDIHGQHEHQNLLKRDEQRNLLDAFAGELALVTKVSELAQQWRAANERLTTLENLSQAQTAKLDLLRYQIQELDELGLSEQELQSLEQEHKQLANADNLIQQYQQIIGLLEEAEKANVLSQLNQVKQMLSTIQGFNPKLTNTHELLTSAIVQVEEVTNDIRYCLDRTEIDPGRLQWIEQRLQKIYDTARKHRLKPEELYQHHQALINELASYTLSDNQLAELRQQITALQQDYATLAKQLSAKRAQAARLLSTQVTASMQQLGMPGGCFEVVLEPQLQPEPNAKGLERAEFQVATNPGQHLQPLTKVVSGGELSRISLAIQVITANQASTSTLVFDEVDVGIGGSTAAVVGQLLRKLGERTQVLCITHLPQVAACGHHHYQVKKLTANKATYTEIRILSQEEKVQEIARMLGGLKITEQTMAHAREMLDIA